MSYHHMTAITISIYICDIGLFGRDDRVTLNFYGMRAYEVFTLDYQGYGGVKYIQDGVDLFFDLDDICRMGFDSYDIKGISDTKVMEEFQRRGNDKVYVNLDGVRQLYRRTDTHIPWSFVALAGGIREGLGERSGV